MLIKRTGTIFILGGKNHELRKFKYEPLGTKLEKAAASLPERFN